MDWLQNFLSNKKKAIKKSPSLPVALESRVEFCYSNSQRFEGDERYILSQFVDAPILEEAKDSADTGDLTSAYRLFYEYFLRRGKPVLFLDNSEYSVIHNKFSQFKKNPKIETILGKAREYLSSRSKTGDETNSANVYPSKSAREIQELFTPENGDKLKKSPFADIHELQRVWEDNSHYHFLTLARAFWITGDNNYASNILIQATEWIGANPLWFGINWVDYRSIAVRLLNWMLAVNMCLSCKFVVPEVFFKITSSIILHAAVLANHISKTPKPSLEEIIVLYMFTSHYPELKLAPKWRELVESKLEDTICNEFSQKCLHYSNSLAEHCYKTELLLLSILQQLQNRQRVNDLLFAFCLNALKTIHFFAGPSRIIPYFGKFKSPGILGQYQSLSDYALNLLCLGAVVFNEGKLLFKINNVSTEIYWWLGPNADESLLDIEIQRPSSTLVYFVPNGLGVVRDHCEAKSSQCIAIGNPLFNNNVENHCDCLSLILTIEDEPFFIDPGNCREDKKELKEYLDSFAAHSAPFFTEEIQPIRIGYYGDLTSDNIEQISEIYGLENYTIADRSICSPLYKKDIKDKKDIIYKCGRQARLRNGLTILIIREILFMPDDKRIIIRDSFSGPESAKQLHLQSSLLFSPHLKLIMRGDMGCFARGKKLSARVFPLFPRGTKNLKGKGMATPLPTGWYYENGNMWQTNQIRYYSTIDLPQKTYITVDWTGKESCKLSSAKMDELFDRPSPD
ncbi:heparinase II/III family protein [bacterium]|nr:heparinase II/III family protein [bacterium]